MRLRSTIRRPRLQFTLRTLFILVTLIAVWFGYYANWIHQRREARKWLDAHPLRGEPYGVCIVGQPDLPWPLKMLGEEHKELRIVRPLDEELGDGLAGYRDHLAETQKLFPECYLADTSDDR